MTQKEFDSKIQKNTVDAIKKVPIFSEFSQEQLEIVAGYMAVFEISKGDVVFLEGEKGDYMCFVVKGRLQVSKKSASGELQVLSELEQGSSVGEMAVLDDFPRSANVTAVEDTRFSVLSREGFEAILNDYPEVGVNLLKGITSVLSLSLRRTSEDLAGIMLPLV